MYLFTLFAVIVGVLAAMALILNLRGLGLSGWGISLLLLSVSVFEAHSRADFRVGVFGLSLMWVGFLRELAVWRTQGRPRTAWLEKLLFPGRRVQIASFVLVLGIGGYLLKQSLAELPPTFPQHGGACQPTDCSESSDLFCDDACGYPVCLSIPASSINWTCCTPDAPVRVQKCPRTANAAMCCQWLKAGTCSCHISTPPLRADLSLP